MTKLLNNGPEEHLDLVEKMQKGLKVRRIDDDLRLKGIWLRREGADIVQIYFLFQNLYLVFREFIFHRYFVKVAQKNSSNLLKELAIFEAAKIKANKPEFCVVHK